MLDPTSVAIVCGGTKWGIPHTAMTLAKELGFKVIGIFPLTGAHYACLELLDLAICVDPIYGDSRWGDESVLFSKVADGIVIIGGGAGTMIEVSHVLKVNESIMSVNKKTKQTIPIKPVIPIAGTGGVADSGMHHLWINADLAAECIPQQKIFNGAAAAHILNSKLNINNNQRRTV
jgi:SLOG cluster4 family